jgi:hypothetical protein
MKFFDFWFDLPKALVNLAQDSITEEEIEVSNVINNSYEVKYKILIY